MTTDSGVVRMSIATNSIEAAARMNHSSVTPSSIGTPFELVSRIEECAGLVGPVAGQRGADLGQHRGLVVGTLRLDPSFHDVRWPAPTRPRNIEKAPVCKVEMSLRPALGRRVEQLTHLIRGRHAVEAF